ncbi:MAG: gfo/Idh/MocA family oxidoreductase, partial [Rariglobus sp.]
MSTQSPLRVGISGFGRSGFGIHAHAFGLLPNLFTVKSVYDPLESRRADIPAGATAATSFESLIADPDLDLIVVAPP